MALHNLLGEKGEEIAADWLVRNGYSILHRNWRTGKLELDIVAKKGNILAICEVKTRKNCRYGTPDSFVSETKIRHLVDAAEIYVQSFERDEEVRFDIISVVITPSGTYSLEHIPDAFYPPLEKV